MTNGQGAWRHVAGAALMAGLVGCASGAGEGEEAATPDEATEQATPSPAPAPDPMAPTSSAEDALVGSLRAVTVVTADADAALPFYEEGLSLSASEAPPTDTLASHWGATRINRVITLSRPGAEGAAVVRLVEVPGAAEASRPGYDSQLVGALGFGLPGSDLDGRTARVEAAGYETTAGVQRMDFPRADGSTYEVGEVHLKAPDDVLVLGVDRGEMTAIGPIDEAERLGGVAYASMLARDASETGRFLRDVLGLEQRRAMSFRSSGPGGGMVGMVKGEEVSFEQWFSPGATTGYLVLMELLDRDKAEAGSLGMESRGVSMLSFETDDLAEVARRWRAFSGEDATPEAIDDPSFGRVASLMIRTPDGLPVQVFERAGRT